MEADLIRDDFVLRQIRMLVASIARLLGKRAAPEEIDAACAVAVGLDLDVAEQLPPGALIALLTTADGLDAERCLALGLGLAVRARSARTARPEHAARLARTAAVLVATALAARPALDEPAVQEVLSALAAEGSGGGGVQ